MLEQQGLRAEGYYTTKVNGRVYKYKAEYWPGNTVKWKADVYLDNVYQGTPGGEIEDNRLEGKALEDEVLTLIFISIETDFGIKLP